MGLLRPELSCCVTKKCWNAKLISRLIVFKEIIAVYCKNLTLHFGSRGSAGDIATCYGLEGRGSNFSRKKGFRLLQNRPDRIWSIYRFILNGYRRSFQWVKRPGHDVNHSTPSSAKVKNEWSYNSASPPMLWAEKTLPILRNTLSIGRTSNTLDLSAKETTLIQSSTTQVYFDSNCADIRFAANSQYYSIIPLVGRTCRSIIWTQTKSNLFCAQLSKCTSLFSTKHNRMASINIITPTILVSF